MPKLTEEHARLLRWNARQRPPLPVCPNCQSPFQEVDAGDLRTDLCTTCEARFIYAIIWRLIRCYGRPAALRKLRRLGRIARPVDVPATV
jgi:predicted amidophosphoribosyltransferase